MGNDDVARADAQIKLVVAGGYNEDGDTEARRRGDAETRKQQDSVELACLQRRLTAELHKLTPMLETMLAMEVASGHVTGEQVLHYVGDHDAARAICRRARAMLGLPPKAPPRPRLGLVSRILSALGMPTTAETGWRTRKLNHAEALLLWQRRLAGCYLPHEKKGRAQGTMDSGQGTGDGDASSPLSTVNCQLSTGAERPLVELGPGGDYRVPITAADLDAGGDSNYPAARAGLQA